MKNSIKRKREEKKKKKKKYPAVFMMCENYE